MDVIDRHRWHHVLMRAAWVGAALLIAASLALVWRWSLQWWTTMDRLERLAAIEGKLTLMDTKLQQLLDRSSIQVLDWKATSSFASGTHRFCDGDDGKHRTCQWEWRSEPDAPSPGQLLGTRLQEGRFVLLIVSPGHDDQALKPETKKEYETNLDLAHARGYALMSTLLKLPDGKRCEDEYPRLRCVVSPSGATTGDGKPLASDRRPSLTAFVTGVQQ
jgi:hypothetical protein